MKHFSRLCLAGALLVAVVFPRAVHAEPIAVKWPQPGGAGTAVVITYSYSNLLDGSLLLLSPSQLRVATEEALGLWASYAPLFFVEVRDAGPSPSDVAYAADGFPLMRFGVHPGTDLAHGFLPGDDGLAGDVHFDMGIPWSLEESARWNFLETATHEIGHALGLYHTDEDIAIMNALYSQHRFGGLGSGFLLPHDIAALQSLYGAGHGAVLPVAPTPEPATLGFVAAGLAALAWVRWHTAKPL